MAHLPAATLKSLEDEKSLYGAGWSHGKEKLGDKPDFAKGSFYFNPLSDLPGTEELREKYPLSYPINVWPTENLPSFEPAGKHVGKIMHEVVVQLSKHLDAFTASLVKEYPKGLLSDAMKVTDKAKGRLLYYFPPAMEEEEEETEEATQTGSGATQQRKKQKKAPAWIGWHNDSGFLTALAGDIFVNHETGEIIDCPDKKAGLYIESREGTEVKAHIPEDCMAVQLGECVQIISGGVLTATPHYVKPPASKAGQPGNVARISFPCFIDTRPDFKLEIPSGTEEQVVLKSSFRVPALEERWTGNGMVFGDFLSATFKKYYEHNLKQTSL